MTDEPHRKSRVLIGCSLALLVAALAGLHFVPPQVAAEAGDGLGVGRAFVPSLVLILVATAAWIHVCIEVSRGRFRPRFAVALLLAFSLRALVFPLAPAMSDDIYRYVHEGQMVLALQNPYLTAPADVAAEFRDPAIHPFINNPTIPAAYPPAMQGALAAAAATGLGVYGPKLVFGLLDLGLFALLWLLLVRVGLPPARALIHGLCPLVVFEFAGEGHGDSLAVLATVAAFLCVRMRWAIAAGVALAIATGAKFLPALFLPFVVREVGVGRRIRTILAFGLALLAMWLPFAWVSLTGEATPLAWLDGTLRYASEWRHNDSLFALLHAPFKAWEDQGALGGFEAQRLAKIPLAVFGLGLLLWAYARRVRLEIVAGAFFLFFLAATPTLHPWYALFPLPFLAFMPWGDPWKWPNAVLLVFFGTLFASYHVLPGWLEDQVWEEQTWVKVLEFLPLYLGVAFGWRRRAGAITAPAAPTPD